MKATYILQKPWHINSGSRSRTIVLHGSHYQITTSPYPRHRYLTSLFEYHQPKRDHDKPSHGLYQVALWIGKRLLQLNNHIVLPAHNKMESLTLEETPLSAGPMAGSPMPLGPGIPPPQNQQLPPQMFTTAAQLLDLTDSKIS